MNFQQIVLLIAALALIGSLILIGLALNNVNKDLKFPPIVADCPDYWKNVSQEGENGMCFNTHNLGTESSNCDPIPDTMDFSAGDYTGGDGLCAKKTWANNCQLTWDGITNNSEICKEKTN